MKERKTWLTLTLLIIATAFLVGWRYPQAKFLKVQTDPIANSWMMQFADTVKYLEVEKTAYELARKYKMRVRKNGVIAGKFVSVYFVFMTGNEESAVKLSENSLVERVVQDSGTEIFPFEIPGAERPKSEKLEWNTACLKPVLADDNLTDESWNELSDRVHKCGAKKGSNQ